MADWGTGMDAATQELLGLHEAGWWALVERFQAALGLAALALGGFSLLAVALALVEWAVGRRAAGVPRTISPSPGAPARTAPARVTPAAIASTGSAAARAALAHAAIGATPVPARRRGRTRTRALVRHLAYRVVCPIRAAARHEARQALMVAAPIHVATGAGR